MDLDCFWLTDAQFATIAAHLPRDTSGKLRVDDRRVISGIIHVLTRDGGGWMRRASTDPARRSTTASSAGRQGVWVNLFHTLANAGGPPAHVLIDSTAVKAHRSWTSHFGVEGSVRNPSTPGGRNGR